MFKKKEKVSDVIFTPNPQVRVRAINSSDSNNVILNKKKYPFELNNSIKLEIITTKRKIEIFILKGYIWNGADIPRIFWRIIGSRTDNDFLIASMVHDYLLDFKVYILNEILKNQISPREYRRLTSLIFRHIIKKQGTNTIKANVMAWCVDVFQMFNKRGWQCLCRMN